MGETGPSKMALYSLTGHANSPFHAEPAQFEAGVESDALNPSAFRMAAKKTLEVDRVDTSLVYSLSSLVSFSQDGNRPELGSVYRDTIAPGDCAHDASRSGACCDPRRGVLRR